MVPAVAHSHARVVVEGGNKKAQHESCNAEMMSWIACPLNQEPKLNTQFIFSNLSCGRKIPRQKSRNIPPKSLCCLDFEGHSKLLEPHHFTWTSPTPPEDVWTQKFEFALLSLACPLKAKLSLSDVVSSHELVLNMLACLHPFQMGCLGDKLCCC